MEKVKFGIIGAGNMGTGHFRSFMSNLIQNGECIAIADLIPEKLEEKKKSIYIPIHVSRPKPRSLIICLE